MYLKLLFLPILFFSLFSTSCDSSDDATDDPEEAAPLMAEVREDVSYGDHPQQVYDIYLPEGRLTSKTKVIILVHGGGWTGGDKTDVDGFINLVQTNNPDHAIVNMNYILATTGVPAFPNQYLDVQSVVNQLKSQQEELAILPEFGMIGLSAGAHISLMYDSVYDTNNEVKFVADIVGPSDFTDPYFANNPKFNFLLDFLVDEDAYPAGTDYVVANSPALQLSSTTSPTLLFYGDQDPLVPLTNGERLSNNLDEAAVENLFTIYNGGHGDWDAASYLDLQVKVENYINLYLPIAE